MQEDKNQEEYVYLEDSRHGEKTNWRSKLTQFLDSRYFIAAIFLLVSIVSFSLGRLSKISENRPPIRVLYEREGEVKGISTSGPENNSNQETVVASKNGTKYHYPWCAGAKQISEKNKIIFNSIEEARASGYTPASNCKGLK